jgi:hypothetical protein
MRSGDKYGVSADQLETRWLDRVRSRAGNARLRDGFGLLLKRGGVLPGRSDDQQLLQPEVLLTNTNVFQKAIDMPVPILKLAIDKLYAAFRSIDILMFIGGEPTLSPDVIEFVVDMPPGGPAARVRKGFRMISGVK